MHYSVDRTILKKIKLYDKYLSIKWNEQKEYFELWREMPLRKVLVTPITKSLYYENGPIEFVELDERLIWWLSVSDSWKSSPKDHALIADKRWLEFHKEQDKKRRNMFRDFGKDTWSLQNSFYATRYKTTKTKPFNKEKKQKRKFLRPDCQHIGTSRVFSRSKQNAISYNYKG